MTTEQINNQRLDLVRVPVSSLLLELTKRYVLPRRQKRIIAIGRCVNGGAFTVTAPGAPVDFADAVAEVFAPSHVATVAMASDVHDEKIGEEFSTRPWQW